MSPFTNFSSEMLSWFPLEQEEGLVGNVSLCWLCHDLVCVLSGIWGFQWWFFHRAVGVFEPLSEIPHAFLTWAIHRLTPCNLPYPAAPSSLSHSLLLLGFLSTGRLPSRWFQFKSPKCLFSPRKQYVFPKPNGEASNYLFLFASSSPVSGYSQSLSSALRLLETEWEN